MPVGVSAISRHRPAIIVAMETMTDLFAFFRCRRSTIQEQVRHFCHLSTTSYRLGRVFLSFLFILPFALSVSIFHEPTRIAPLILLIIPFAPSYYLPDSQNRSSCLTLSLLVSSQLRPVSSFPITRREVNDALIPQFGFSSGVNPTGASLRFFESILSGLMRLYTGTGDCRWRRKREPMVNPSKFPAKAVPPDRATFIKVRANTSTPRVLRVSHARLLNPTTNILSSSGSECKCRRQVTRPQQLSRPHLASPKITPRRLNSPASTAASVTLQNLNGSGKGCPVASTTFQAQAAAINNAGT